MLSGEKPDTSEVRGQKSLLLASCFMKRTDLVEEAKRKRYKCGKRTDVQGDAGHLSFFIGIFDMRHQPILCAKMNMGAVSQRRPGEGKEV